MHMHINQLMRLIDGCFTFGKAKLAWYVQIVKWEQEDKPSPTMLGVEEN